MRDWRELAGRTMLVTGATGFIGSHLVATLTRAGSRVHAIARRPNPRIRVAAGPIAWHQADVTDAVSLRKVVDHVSPEIVFHLAAAGTTYDQQDYARMLSVNVTGALNLWQALDGSPARLVFAGSCGEYGQTLGPIAETRACRPTWFYPATVHAAVTLVTTLARESDRHLVVLRPFGPYGPADNSDRILPRVIEALLRGDEVPVTAGDQLRDFLFVEDHVAAFLLAALVPKSEPGAVYNCGSGIGRPLREVIEIAARLIGPDAPARVRFGAVPYRPSEVWQMYADISAARRDLGFAPSVSLEDGLARTIEWYRQQRLAVPERTA